MSGQGVRYESKTVRAVKGREARTLAKWQEEGWELVSQVPGKLSTEFTLRKPKPPTPWRWYLIAGGAFVALIAVFLVLSWATGEGENPPGATQSPTNADRTEGVSEENSTPSSDTDGATDDGASPITVTNDPEFAALLALTDYCDDAIATFADEHAGETIAFDANVGAIAPHDGAETRYDILVGAGDYSQTSAPGPAFQFRDVNTTSDLHDVGEVPESIGVGTALHVTARVDRFEPSSCLFLLDPVETEFR